MDNSANLACLRLINIGLVVDVFWEIVTHYIPANQLVIRISDFLPRTFYKLFHFRLDKLCKLGRDPEKSDCDFLVLYDLIRDLCPLSPPSAGWFRPPTPNATSILDDVERIRKDRETIIRHTDTDGDFQGYIEKYETVLGRLDIKLGTNFRQRLHAIVNESIERANRDITDWCADLLNFESSNAEATDNLVEIDEGFDDLEENLTSLQRTLVSDRESYLVRNIERHLTYWNYSRYRFTDLPILVFHIRKLILFPTKLFVTLNLQANNMLQTCLTQTFQEIQLNQTIAIRILNQISRLQPIINKFLKMQTSRNASKKKKKKETTSEEATKDHNKQAGTGSVASIKQDMRRRTYTIPEQQFMQEEIPHERWQLGIDKNEQRPGDLLDIRRLMQDKERYIELEQDKRASTDMDSFQRPVPQRTITQFLPAATGIDKKRFWNLRPMQVSMEESEFIDILKEHIRSVTDILVDLEHYLQETTSQQATLDHDLQQRIGIQPIIHAKHDMQQVINRRPYIEERVQNTGSPQTTCEQSLPSRTQHESVAITAYDPLLLLYAELKDTLRRDQCRAIAKDIEAERPYPAEENVSFQNMTKRRDLADWVLKYVLKQKDEMIFKIFCKSLRKQSPLIGQTLQEMSVHVEKTERQPTTLQLDDVDFLQRSSKLVVDITIDKLLSQFLITVEEHSSIRSSSDGSEMIKRLVALLQYDKAIMRQFKLITQPFRNASVSETADWLVPLHAQAKENLSYGKGIAIATDIFQQIPGIISPSDLDELYDLKDSSRDVIDRLLKHIYRHPRPEVFDVICYSLEDHDEDLYEHFLRILFFKGCDKEKTKPVVNKASDSGIDHFTRIQWNRQTLDVVIDHLLSSFCITVDEHSDIRDAGITKLVKLLGRSPQMIMAVNAILRHLDKIADTTNIGNKEITISLDFGDPKVNSQARNHMDSLCGKTLTLAGIGEFYLKDVKEGSVMITLSPLDEESLRLFRDMEKDGTILVYLRDHVNEFLPDDVEVVLSESLIGTMEKTTCLPVQSASIINSTVEFPSRWVYKMKNEPFIQPSILQPDHSKRIGSIRMFLNEPLSRETESNSPGRGIVFAGQLGSNGESLAIKRMLLRKYYKSLERYETVKERLQHQNIVKILCVEKDEKYGYVAMERMDENLVQYVARSGQHGNTDMNTEEEIYYMKHIVTGLTFIHKKGFLHNMFSPKAILLKKNNPDTHPKQVSITGLSDAALCEHVPVTCKKGENDILELIKVLLFVLNKEEAVVNGVIQPDNRIIQSGHFDIYVLLQDMLASRKSDELKLHEFALHPALSNPSDQLLFLKESSRLGPGLSVDFNLTNRTLVNTNNRWLDEPPLTHIVHQYLTKVRTPCTYRPHCLNSLVRCIRNCHEHLPEIMLQVQEEFGPKERYIYYWLVKFPGLVSSVYEAMSPHRNDPDLSRFFTIES